MGGWWSVPCDIIPFLYLLSVFLYTIGRYPSFRLMASGGWHQKDMAHVAMVLASVSVWCLAGSYLVY